MADRRSFLALVGITVGAASSAGSVVANEEQADEETESANEEEAERPAEADALLGYIDARYGDRLDKDQRAEVGEQIAGSLEDAATVGEVELENGDEPAFRFQADRGEES